MKLSNQIRRYTLIVELLRRRKYPKKEEILDYLNDEMQLELEKSEDEKLRKAKGKAKVKGTKSEEIKIKSGISDRNVDRDLKALRKNGFIIEYHPRHKGYYIDEVTQKGEAYGRMLEALHLSQLYKVGEKIQLEKVGSTGYQYLHSMMDAIDNKKVIEFYYQKFEEDKGSLRKLAPYFIKEFKRRLYVIGKDYKDDRVKTFAFDRMIGAFVTNELFRITEDYSKYFEDCYGIVNDFESEPSIVLLKAHDNKASYIKTLPLHASQKLVEETDNYTIFELKVKLTYDFIMELMSHANQLEVLQPEELRIQLKRKLKAGVDFYKNDED